MFGFFLITLHHNRRNGNEGSGNEFKSINRTWNFGNGNSYADIFGTPQNFFNNTMVACDGCPSLGVKLPYNNIGINPQNFGTISTPQKTIGDRIQNFPILGGILDNAFVPFTKMTKTLGQPLFGDWYGNTHINGEYANSDDAVMGLSSSLLTGFSIYSILKSPFFKGATFYDYFRFQKTVIPNNAIVSGTKGARIGWALKGGGMIENTGFKLPFHYHIHRYNLFKPWLWFKNVPILK